MYSFWNLVAATVCFVGGAMIPAFLVDVVRASSVAVLAGVLAYLGAVAPKRSWWDVLGPVQKRFYEAVFVGVRLPAGAWLLLDAVVHLGPLVMLGLPRGVGAYPVGLALMLAWYYGLVRGEGFGRVYPGLGTKQMEERILPVVVVAVVVMTTGTYFLRRGGKASL